MPPGHPPHVRRRSKSVGWILPALVCFAACSGRVERIELETADCGAGVSGEADAARSPEAAPDVEASAPPDSAPLEASVDAAPAEVDVTVPEAAEASTPQDAATEARASQDAPSDGDTLGPPTDAPIDAPAHCFDHQKDGDESDVDCGGSCAGCGPGRDCYANFDCSAEVSGCDAANGGCVCHPTMHVCVYDHCYDTIKDANETGVDCGGGLCAPCAVGTGCNTNSDCSSGACDAVSFVCVGGQCYDRHQDGTETDVDCGGSCDGCGPGEMCGTNFDCVSGHPCSTTTHRCL